MHVRCSNCGIVYDKNDQVKVCVRCKSNASEPPMRGSIGRTESAPPSGRRMLHDDMPAPKNLITG